jgi:hypothetical protein
MSFRQALSAFFDKHIETFVRAFCLLGIAVCLVGFVWFEESIQVLLQCLQIVKVHASTGLMYQAFVALLGIGLLALGFISVLLWGCCRTLPRKFRKTPDELGDVKNLELHTTGSV